MSDRQAMHILMAAVEALEVPADELVINRTSMQQLRSANRHNQYDDERSDFVDKVKKLNLISFYLKYLVLFFFFSM